MHDYSHAWRAWGCALLSARQQNCAQSGALPHWLLMASLPPPPPKEGGPSGLTRASLGHNVSHLLLGLVPQLPAVVQGCLDASESLLSLVKSILLGTDPPCPAAVLSCISFSHFLKLLGDLQVCRDRPWLVPLRSLPLEEGGASVPKSPPTKVEQWAQTHGALWDLSLWCG